MNFESDVLKAQIPVVVDFYADWCGPCKLVAPILERLEKQYAGKVKLVKVDVDKNQELAAEYGIMSIPTVIFFKKGIPMESVIGAIPEQVFKHKIDKLVK
ncbi:MAG: thioredoxin [Nitrososphaerota archaeon]|jgi:thioredoxin 1|nr:thioredoxin [Nitrososphaerota archaeon]MDG6948859.1 thioredoxin [Nitrososphaerota archaeon]